MMDSKNRIWIVSGHNSEDDYMFAHTVNGTLAQVAQYLLKLAHKDKLRYETDYEEECEYFPESIDDIDVLDQMNGFMQTELCMSDSHVTYLAVIDDARIDLTKED